MNPKSIFTRSWVIAFISLTCISLTTSAMNIAVFPYLDTVLPAARETSTFANLIGCIIIGALSFLWPRLLKWRGANVIACGLILVSICTLPLAMGLSCGPLLIVAVVCSGFARAWVILVVGMSAARLTRVQAGSAVTAALFANYLLSLILWIIPTLVSVIMFLVLPLAALFLAERQAWPLFEAAAEAEKPLDLVITQPNTFLPLGSQVFICLLLFRFAFGFSLRFGENSGVPLMDFWAVIVIVLIGAYMVISRRTFPADGLVTCAILLIIAGFYIMSANLGSSAHLGITLLSAGSVAFDLVSWLTLLAVAARNRYGAVASFTWGHGLMCLGSILGARGAVAANMLIANNSTAFLVLNGLFIVGFAAWGLIGLRNFSFAAVINAVVPAVDVVPPARDDSEDPSHAPDAQPLEPDSGQASPTAPAIQSVPEPDTLPLTLEKRCDIVAEQGKLTPRERQVLTLLARGRDRAYIENHLTVSKNTVKAHVKHIYTKLGIHSHQELLDLIESVEGP